MLDSEHKSEALMQEKYNKYTASLVKKHSNSMSSSIQNDNIPTENSYLDGHDTVSDMINKTK